MDSLRRTTLSVGSCLALLTAPVVMATPALAAPPPPVVYDALGDSYASGAGVPPYDAATCQRSELAPARLLDGRMRIQLDDFVACSGAVTADIAGQAGAALDAETKLVTLSVGGNDVAWIEAVAACWLGGEDQCAQAIAASEGLVTTALPAQLDAAYDAVAAAAPNAHVVVTGYPEFFSSGYGDYVASWDALGLTGTFTVAEQELMNDGAQLLNATIADVAAEHGFQFVDVTKRFADHGVNADDPWIGDFNSLAAFHPNARGYETYAAALTAAMNPRSLR